MTCNAVKLHMFCRSVAECTIITYVQFVDTQLCVSLYYPYLYSFTYQNHYFPTTCILIQGHLYTMKDHSLTFQS
jgi:hypothetical protein